MNTFLELDQLLSKHRPSLVKRARYLLGDSEVAEDVVQDALVYVASRSREFANQEDLVAALYWKVRYLAIDFSRRKSMLPLQVELDWVAEESVERLDEYELGEDEGKEVVALALAKLSDAQRTALVLTAVDEVSQQQAARQLEISHDAVRQLLRRAKINFRANLETELQKRGWRKSDLLSFLAAPSMLLALLIPFSLAPDISDATLSAETYSPTFDELRLITPPAEVGAGGEIEIDGNDSIINVGPPETSEDFSQARSAGARTSGLQQSESALSGRQLRDDLEDGQVDIVESEFLRSIVGQQFEEVLASRLPSIFLTFDQTQLEGFWNTNSQLEIPVGESLVFFIELNPNRFDGRVEITNTWGTLDLEDKLVAFTGATSAQQWSSSLDSSESTEKVAAGSLHFVSRDLVFGDVSAPGEGSAIDGVRIGRDIIQIRLDSDSDGQITVFEILFS